MITLASAVTISMVFHGIWALLTRPYAEPHSAKN